MTIADIDYRTTGDQLADADDEDSEVHPSVLAGTGSRQEVSFHAYEVTATIRKRELDG